MQHPRFLFDPVWQFVLLVALPGAAMGMPYLYADNEIGVVSLYIAGMSVIVDTLMFHNEYRRLKVLRRNLEELQAYDGPYVLMLRSFANSEGYQTYARVIQTEGYVSPYVESEIGAFEAALRLQDMRLVAVGGGFTLPVDHRLIWLNCEDMDWEHNVHLLAAGARAILVFPETTEGIRQELRFIRDKALVQKTVFYMPPTPPGQAGLVHYDTRDAKAQRWETVRAAMIEEGIRLPAYDPKGCLFTLGDDLAADRVVPVQVIKWLNTTSGKLRRKDRAVLEPLGLALLDLTESTNERGFQQVRTGLRLIQPDLRKVSLLDVPGSSGEFLQLFVVSIFGVVLINLMAISMAALITLLVGWTLFVITRWLLRRLRRTTP